MPEKPTYEELEKRIIQLEAEQNRYSQVEVELKRSLRFTESLLSALPTPIFFKDAQGRYQGCNPAFTEIMGVTPQQICGKFTEDLWPSELAEEYHQKDLELLDNQKHQVYEFEIRDKSGTIRPVFFYKNVFYDENAKVAGLVGGFVDITERKQAETVLQESEERYRLLADNVNDNIWIFDFETSKFSYVSPSVIGITGFSSEEATGFQLEDSLTPQSLEIANQVIAEELTAASQNFDPTRSRTLELEQYHKRGSTVWTEVSVKFLYDNKKQPTAILGITRDITERKKAELEMLENEQRNNKAQRLGHVGNWEYDLIAQNFLASIEAKRIFGFNPEKHDLTPRMIENCIPERKKVHQAFLDLVRENKPYNLECEIQPVTGPHRRIVKSVAEVIRDDAGTPLKVVGLIQDITTQKNIEKEKSILEKNLQQAQKMEAIGTLAGGIAHDFNNILTPLVGYAELLKMELPENHPSKTYADIMLQSSLRARDLVNQILAFSRKSELEISPIKLQPIVYECTKLLRSSIPKSIEIEQHIDSDCSPVNADPTKFHQIIMNLATNAFHAMEKTGGKLTLSLKRTRIDQDHSEISDLLPGSYIQLTVADTGIGMTSDVLDKVFDPYFTTKEKEKGTGLGLAVVYGIVKECGGDIKVDSEPAKGTQVHVRLPAIKGMDVERSEVAGPLTGGTERILVVDDEVFVANMEQEMLKVLGYQVTVRTRSLEALESFRNNPDKFDLIITDMSMPNMSGIQFAQEIKKIDASIPIIICTGFSEQLTHENFESLGIKGYLMKPVVMRQLSETIRKVLDEAKDPVQ